MPVQTKRASLVRRSSAVLAAALATVLAAAHTAWALGARTGYSACGWGQLTSEQARTGCGAASVPSVGLVDGPLAATGWVVVAIVSAVVLRRPSATRMLALLTVAVLLVIAFPLHLLFEVPLGLAGEPTDWPHLTTRLLTVVVAGCLFVAVHQPPCRHSPRKIVALSTRGRATIAVAAAVPLLGWTLPHLAWVANVPLGLSEQVLAEARSLPIAAQLAVTLAPVGGAALTLGLGQPWAQQLPPRVPSIGGRPVPRAIPIAGAATVGLLLTAYGSLGTTLMVHDILTSRTTLPELTTGWAAAGTEVLFTAWGIALLLAAATFAKETACPQCTTHE